MCLKPGGIRRVRDSPFERRGIVLNCHESDDGQSLRYQSDFLRCAFDWATLFCLRTANSMTNRTMQKGNAMTASTMATMTADREGGSRIPTNVKVVYSAFMAVLIPYYLLPRLRAGQFPLVLRCRVDRDADRLVDGLEVSHQHSGRGDCVSAISVVCRLLLQHGFRSTNGRPGDVHVRS